MTDMNEKDIIRCFAEMADYDLGEKTVETDLSRVREMLTGPTAARRQRKPIWRTIMLSKWTRLSSAAAIVIAAVFVGISLFSNSKLEASELLAQVARNMEKLTWLKAVTERYVPDQNEPVGASEHWMDVENKRVYAIYDGKYIHLMDYTLGQWSIYRPDTNDMVVKPLTGEWTSPTTEIEGYIKKLKREGLEVKQTERTQHGEKVIVMEFDEVLNDVGSEAPITAMMMNDKSVKTIRCEIVVARDRRTLISGAMTYLDRAGDVIAIHRSRNEPVTTGPTDIYELGVPQDVTIINRMPSETVSQIRQQIDASETQFLDEYIAVITEAKVEGGREDIREACVAFCQGTKLRVDVYRKNYGTRDPLTARYRAELEPSLRYLSPFWPNEDERTVRGVRLYDGLWQYILEAKEDTLVARDKQRRPDGDLYADDDVEDFAWRTLWWLNRPEHMYEDTYSQENGLIAMELTAQALGSQLPRRLVLYVDPERDYVCDRYIEQQLLDAPWQQDKTWLDNVSNKNSLTEYVRDAQVSQYARTESGQWYPKVITETGYTHEYNYVTTNTKRVIRIHLVAEHPQFPDGIFDPNGLPQAQPQQ